jgi:hypothetical protein
VNRFCKKVCAKGHPSHISKSREDKLLLADGAPVSGSRLRIWPGRDFAHTF